MITIKGFPIDAAITEEHTYNSEVTSYPVEAGSDITDNVRVLPIEITIEGLVSNTPLVAMANIRNVLSGLDIFAADNTTPSSNAFDHLRRIRDAREPVSITTSLKLYENMVMESLSFPRDSDTGSSLRFNATFKQVIIVDNRRSFVPTAVPRAQSKRRRGHKQSKAVIGYGTYLCVRDVVGFVKPTDFWNVRDANANASPKTWTDFAIGHKPPYTTKHTICVEKQQVFVTGNGQYLEADQKTPLPLSKQVKLKEQVNTQAGVDLDKRPPTETATGRALGRVDRKAPSGPNPLAGNQPAKPWWEENTGLKASYFGF